MSLDKDASCMLYNTITIIIIIVVITIITISICKPHSPIASPLNLSTFLSNPFPSQTFHAQTVHTCPIIHTLPCSLPGTPFSLLFPPFPSFPLVSPRIHPQTALFPLTHIHPFFHPFSPSFTPSPRLRHPFSPSFGSCIIVIIHHNGEAAWGERSATSCRRQLPGALTVERREARHTAEHKNKIKAGRENQFNNYGSTTRNLYKVIKYDKIQQF